MSERCPTCGQEVPQKRRVIQTVDELMAAMRIPTPRSSSKSRLPPYREVYEGADPKNTKVGSGRYYVTHGGLEVSRQVIDEALKRGLIRHVSPDYDGYWCLNV